MKFESPESYIPDIVVYFNLEFFGADWKNQANIFTVNDFIFIDEFIVNGVLTLFYKVHGESISGTISVCNGGVMIGMDTLPK